MRCSVENCINDSRRKTKFHGITFHRFPKEPDLRNLWMEALVLSEWDLSDRSVVCSDHFQQDAFYRTKCGLRRIKFGAVPQPILTSCVDLDDPVMLRVCRICLSVDGKMYYLLDNQLGQMYEQIIGLPIDSDDKLPQKVCWECAARLSSANTFRSKALKAWGILMNKLDVNKHITIGNVKSIRRDNNELESSLGIKVRQVNDCDLHIEENEVVNFEDNNDNHDFNDDFDFNDNDDNNDLKEKEVEIYLKDEENNEIFYEEVLDFDSDDSRTLDEVYKKNGDNDKLKEAKKEGEDSEDYSPLTTMNNYQTFEMKMRPVGLDDFTITKITYEEQIEEIERRKETESYKSAPYKCTICYRGFRLQGLADAHAVRHSKKRGDYECIVCKTRCRSRRVLSQHITSRHVEKITCKRCPFVTNSRCSAREHGKWHAGMKYECPHCSVEFDKRSTYMTHLRIKHGSEFVCELCGFTFINEMGANIHKKKSHRMIEQPVVLEGPYCEVCDVRFVSEEAYSRHLKVSSKHISDDDPNRLWNDSQILVLNRTRKNVQRAIIKPRSTVKRRRVTTAPVTCEQCGLQLRNMRLYVHHFKRFHPDKHRTKYPSNAPFMCEQCGRIYPSMSLLKDHMWVHTGKKSFICDICGKSFTQKPRLVFHMNAHNGHKEVFDCPTCGKGFSSDNNRTRHMLIHTGQKPFKCDTCGKCFTTYGEKRAHVDHVHLKKPWPKRVRNQKRVKKLRDAEETD